jgi:hypothetical protein
MHFEPNRYRKFGIASTGKARGFQPPALAKAEPAAATEPPATRPSPNRPKDKSARTGKPDAPFRFLPFASIFSN